MCVRAAVGCPSVPAAKAELKRVQAAAEQQRAVMAAELAAAQTAEAAARAEASKARAAHASCSCQLQEAQQEVLQVCTSIVSNCMQCLSSKHMMPSLHQLCLDMQP